MSEGSESQNPMEKGKQDNLFEDREPKKIIRIITVTAYMCSVSFVGVVLSAYYIFLWHPPNPRLMHQQVSRHDPRVDYLYQPADVTTMKVVNPNVLDLFKHVSPDAETLKTRREIVKNVNAILSANFEKVKFTETSSITEAAKVLKFNDNIDTSGTLAPTKATEDSSTTSETFSSISPEENEKLSSEQNEDSISNDNQTAVSIQTSTLISQSRRTKKPGKKPHQTPFALKHLEVPIKLEPTRRRPIRLSTTATVKSDSSNIPDSSRGTLSDIITGITASTSDSSEILDNASPRHVANSLYKILTSPPILKDIDYSSSTDLPQIFPALPHANNDNDDYHDATIAPIDDIIDD